MKTSLNMWQKAIVTIRQDVDVAVVNNYCVVTYQENLSSVSNSTFFAHRMTSALEPKRMEVESFGYLIRCRETFPKRDFFQITKELEQSLFVRFKDLVVWEVFLTQYWTRMVEEKFAKVDFLFLGLSLQKCCIQSLVTCKTLIL